MARNRIKKTSKRLTCRKRYKIEKKVKEHHRKVRKEAKKKGPTSGRKPQEILQIPNKCPFKEELLLEAKQRKEAADLQKEKLKERQKLKKKEAKKKSKTGNLENLVADAQQKQIDFDEQQSIQLVDKPSNVRSDASLKAYASEVRKVIEQADVVFEVLDARDPLGSRCTDVENRVRESGKRLILLLNKIDLVPRANVQNWLAYLRNEFPSIAFKASTQEQRTNLGRGGTNLNSTNSKCIGADLVMKLLGNYCRNRDLKTSIRVGIVGFPNVGKSSVINSLKRKRTCNVGAMPGITKSVQEVDLGANIRLLDSPGVVLSSNKALDPAEMALKNAVRAENIQDPVAPVLAILRRCSKDMLMLQYNIPEFDDCDTFLALIAKKIGRLKKGARPDINAAARKVLTDWNSGKLRYYTQAPEKSEKSAEEAQILTEMSKEFSLDEIDNEQDLIVTEMPENTQMDECVLENDTVMDSEDQPLSTILAAPEEKEPTGSEEKEKISVESTLAGNQQLNKLLKTASKKQKKRKLKTARRADKLADTMDAAMELGDDDYDFDTDFTA